MKRITVLFIITTVLLFCSSCSDVFMTQSQADKLTYYSTIVEFPKIENEVNITYSYMANNLNDFFFTADGRAGRTVRVTAYDYEKQKLGHGYCIQLVDPAYAVDNTTVVTLQALDEATQEWDIDRSVSIIYNVTTDPEGNFYGLVKKTVETSCSIIKWDSEGKKQFEIPLTEFHPEAYNAFTINTMIAVDKKGYIYLMYLTTTRSQDFHSIIEISSLFAVYSDKGEFLYAPQLSDDLTPKFIEANNMPVIQRDKSGNVNFYYGKYSEDNKQRVYYMSFDHKAKKLVDETMIEDYVVNFRRPSFGEGFEIYYNRPEQKSFVGRNADGSEVILFKHLQAKVDTYGVLDYHVVSHEKIFWHQRITNSDGLAESVITYISTSLPEDNRTPVRIAFDQSVPASATTTLTSLAREFNKTSATHRIDLIPYADDEIGRTAAEKLKQDITTGDIPDMILFGAKLSPDTFINLDILADFYDLMNGEYKKSDFLGCVTKPYETASGELPVLVTDFYLQTLVGKSSVFGERTSWSFEEMLKMNKSLKGDQALIYLSAADDDHIPTKLLEALLPKLLDRFVDYEAQTVDFDNETFRSLLEFCRDAKVLHNRGGIAPNYYHNEDVLLSQITYHFDYFFRDRYLDFPNGDLTYIGYPVTDKNQSGTVILPMLQFGIVKKSANADIAWDFLTDYLDAQTKKWENHAAKAKVSTTSSYPSTEMYYFPATDAALDYMIELARSYRHFYRVRLLERENSAIEAVGYNYHGMPIASMEEADIETETREKMKEFTIYFDVTDNDAAALRSLLDANLTPNMSDSQAIAIIMEDAADWMNGIKTMDEVIRLIENRVSTLVNE